MPRVRAILAAAGLSVAVATAAPAATTESFSAHYSVTLYGMQIARMSFESEFNTDTFNIDGSVSSSGIARVFDRTRGTTSVSGAIGPNGLSPQRYEVSYTSGRKQQRTTIQFGRGGVESTVNEPAPRRRGNDWVAIADGHLRAVMDPITSTLVRASDPQSVCNRSINVFDGEMVATLALSHASTGPAMGFADAVTCNARFVPVAGYRKGRADIEFMKNESRISITFARLGAMDIYTPVDATIGTRIGTVRVRAERIAAR